MRYFDFEWDLSSAGIILDDEINLAKLQWQEGDIFMLERLSTGKMILKKKTGVEKFMLEAALMKEENTNG